MSSFIVAPEALPHQQRLLLRLAQLEELEHALVAEVILHGLRVPHAMQSTCMSKPACTQVRAPSPQHTSTHQHSPETRMAIYAHSGAHTHTHAHTRAHTHTITHTHKHMCARTQPAYTCGQQTPYLVAHDTTHTPLQCSQHAWRHRHLHAAC